MEQYRSLSKLRFVIAFVGVVSLKKIRDGSAKKKKQIKRGLEETFSMKWFGFRLSASSRWRVFLRVFENLGEGSFAEIKATNISKLNQVEQNIRKFFL